MKSTGLRVSFAFVLLFVCALSARAQTFSLLHTFADGFPHQDAPGGAVVVSDGVLYGTISIGPSPGDGAIFSLTTNSAYQVMHTFAGTPDGARPEAGLIFSDGVLYGTTQNGGSNGFGSVFSISTNRNYAVLHSFSAIVSNTNIDGVQPQGALVVSGDTLYGTTFAGGTGQAGTVFALNTNGGNFRVLHEFAPISSGASNPDGLEIQAQLLLVGNTLYGTAGAGGPYHWGTVFSLDTSGSNFTVLHSFGSNVVNDNPLDGGLPEGGLVLSEGTLYGTTAAGGIFYGTVFSMNTNGSNFTLVHQFGAALTNNAPGDGYNPNGSLVLSGDTLYGTANEGGGAPNPGEGVVFSLITNGGNFTVLHSFGALTSNTNTDGANPPDQVALSGNVLFGVTTEGGAKGGGTVFAITLPAPSIASPTLTFVPPTPGRIAVTLSWPDTATGFVLETNSDLNNGAGWQIYDGTTIDTNGQETAQVTATAGNSFFRLHLRQ